MDNRRAFMDIPQDWPPNFDKPGATPPDQLGDWGKLARGKTLGKSAIVEFNFTGGFGEAPAPVNVMELRGRDEDAMQLSLIITPPKIGPSTLFVPAGTDPQAVSGPFFPNQAYPLSGGENGNFALPYAKIQWGIGGTLTEAEVDIANGCALNLSASFLRMQVGVDEATQDPGSRVYQLSAFIGPGQPKSGRNATRTVLLGSIGNGLQSEIFPVPAFARSATIIGYPSVVGTLAFLTNTGGGGEVISQFTHSFSNPIPQPVPNGAYYFQVTSGIPVINTFSVLFDLGI